VQSFKSPRSKRAICQSRSIHRDTITASPNPVLVGQGTGTTTVTWNSGDGSAGQVYISMAGEPEAIFASGPPGSAAAPWIEAGKTYEFRLYAGTEHVKMLAKTQVTGQK